MSKQRKIDCAIWILLAALIVLNVGAQFYHATFKSQPGPTKYTEPLPPAAADQVPDLDVVAEQPSRGSHRTIMMQATAYTWTGRKTASQKWPRRGMVAADWSVLPKGTKLIIEGYGLGTVEDTGGAIEGNDLDLYMDTEQEALEWGRRIVEVTIIE